MATISENLQILKDSTDAIKQAIIDKGGTISGDITTWADAIGNIQTGGGWTPYLICRCNNPNPRTGEPVYVCTVFDGITQGSTWNNYVDKVSIDEKYSITKLQLPNQTILAIKGDRCTYGPEEAINLSDVIDTSKIYDFIYG